MAEPSYNQSRLLAAMSVPAAATTLAFVPEFFFDPRTGGSWAALTVVAAPVVAYLMNQRRPVATNLCRALLVGLPQVPLCVALELFDVWLDVRSGYLLAGSGEVAMAVGYGSVFALGFGVVLAALVAAAARFGASHR
jgi:hypothetical protein